MTKIEITKEQYCALREIPGWKVDMEARYFLYPEALEQKRTPGQVEAPLPCKVDSIAVRDAGRDSRFQPTRMRRTPTDIIVTRDESDILTRATQRQAAAFFKIKYLTDKPGGIRSDRLSATLANLMETTPMNAGYYIRELILAGVLGVPV